MSKLFKSFMVLGVSTLMFSGCVGGIEETFKDEPDLTSKKGILTEQISGEPGTHLLTLENESTLPLRSLVLNLSGYQYLNNEVQVMGIFHEEDQVFEVTSISVLEVIESEVDDINLINYKNTDFGINLKYYDNWTISEGETQIVFYSPEDGGVQDKIVISQESYTYADSADYEAALDQYIIDTFPETEDIDSLKHKVGPDGMYSIKIEYPNDEVSFYLYRSGLIYSISYVQERSELNEENLRAFNEMITEFQFMGFTVDTNGLVDESEEPEDPEEEKPVEDISTYLPEVDFDFTTFESLPYKFSAQYPSSWYYAGSSSTEPGVLHHYGLSDETVIEENELISLDVISTEIPNGQNLSIPGMDAVKQVSNSTLTIYVQSDDQNYRISGDSNYEDLMVIIASSIAPIPETEDEAI